MHPQEMMPPVCIFTYKRKCTLAKLINSLLANPESASTDLIIYCDDARSVDDQVAVDEVRKFCEQIVGFRTVSISYADSNKGLAPSVICGVTEVLDNYGVGIFLEDDLVVSKGFLGFMRSSLRLYASSPHVISVCGYTKELPTALAKSSSELYLHGRSSSWGWATWRDKWKLVDFEYLHKVKLIDELTMYFRLFALAPDLPIMARSQKRGKLNSWAVRFVEAQSRLGLYSLFPRRSLVENLGFDKDATHCDQPEGYRSNFKVNNQVNDRIILSKPSIVILIYLWVAEFYFGIRRKIARVIRRL